MVEPASSVDVAIIGGGPAGLAAAIELRRHGVAHVAVLEREAAAGGVPRHCGHPPFGMREFGRVLTGPSYAARLVDAAVGAGADLRIGHSVVSLGEGGRLTVAAARGVSTLTAKRVIIATGAREASRATRLIPGDRPIGVLNTGALQASVYLNDQLPFRRPVIVGSELVSLSAILTCLKAGARPAAMIEARARGVARRPFLLFPCLAGVPMHYSSVVADIRGRPRVDSVLIRHDDGAVSEIACDGVLLTGCFTPEAALARNSHLTVCAGSGGPQIDQFGRCSDPAYFAAGNVLRPIETAGWSFREGRRVGRAVAEDLQAPAAESASGVTLRRGAGVKLLTPQRLVRSSRPRGFDHIQLRVADAVSGDLTVSANGRTLWRRRMSALPERRILIPLSAFAIPEGAAVLDVGFAGDAPRTRVI